MGPEGQHLLKNGRHGETILLGNSETMNQNPKLCISFILNFTRIEIKTVN